MLATNPWKHLNAADYEWLRSEDSYKNSFVKGEPDRVIKNCVYVGDKQIPIYSEDHSMGMFVDFAQFTTIDGKDYEIAKRIVEREGKGKWKINEWFTLTIRGCCNIIGINRE